MSATDVAAIRSGLALDLAMARVPEAAVRKAWDTVESAPGDARLLAAMRLFALAGNGHTRLIPNAAVRVFPLRLIWSGESLWSFPEGREVVHVNSVPVEGLFSRLTPYLAGTAPRQRVIGALPLVWPAALVEIGAPVEGEKVTYGFDDGTERTVGEGDLVDALPLYPVSEQGFPTPGTDPYPARDGILRLPSFAPTGPVEARIGAACDMLDRHRGPLVVDLRGNAGGDFIRHLPILDQIETRGGPVSVLVDRFTFSAAIVFAAVCKARAGARIVGEEMGDGPAFWAEGGTLTLPESGAAIRYSNGWHDWETGIAAPDTPREIARHMRACGSLLPDVPAVTTPGDIARGDDPARDAALASS